MSGSVGMDEVVAVLASDDRAWVRIAISKAENWDVRAFEVTLGAPPPRWTPLNWEYPNARLVASLRNAKTVANWLQRRRITLRGSSASLDGLSENALTDRRRSCWEGSQGESLDWPADEWRMSLTDQVNAFNDELIADGAPAFSRFELGVANLLGVSGRPGWNVSSRDVVIRRQDRRARISRVYVDLDGVDVTVEGDAIAGAIVELAGDLPAQTLRVIGDEHETLRFETPDGLPDGAWILVRLGDEWLDRRSLERNAWHQRQEPGVEFASPPPQPWDNSAFSEEERAEIRIALTQVRLLLWTQIPQLEPPQLAAINERLDEVAEALEILGRQQWRSLLYGALLSVAVDRIVPQDVWQEVFGLVAHAVSHVIGLPLPALPT